MLTKHRISFLVLALVLGLTSFSPVEAQEISTEAFEAELVDSASTENAAPGNQVVIEELAGSEGLNLPIVTNFRSTVSDGEVLLEWDPVVLENFDTYVLYLGLTSGNYTASLDLGDIPFHNDRNLTNGQTYFYAIAVRTTDGLEGESVEIPVTPNAQGMQNFLREDALLTTVFPRGGTYNAPVLLTLSSSEQNAPIVYTLDGTDPVENFQSPSVKPYTVPFTITDSTVLKFSARSLRTGQTETVRVQEYVIDPDNPQAIDPNSVQPAGDFAGGQFGINPDAQQGQQLGQQQSAPAGDGPLTLSSNPPELKLGQLETSTLTAQLRDDDGRPRTGELVDFRLSSGDGTLKTLGGAAGTSTLTDDQGRAQLSYTAQKFVGAHMIIAQVHNSPDISAELTLHVKPGNAAKFDILTEALSVLEDTNFTVRIFDQFDNPIEDGTVVLVNLQPTRGEATKLSFQGLSKDGAASIAVPFDSLVEGSYNVTVSASGVLSQPKVISAGRMTALHASGPNASIAFALSLLLGALFFTSRRKFQLEKLFLLK